MPRLGSAYTVLNAIRCLNIIGLLAVMAACIAMLVRTTTSSKFFFFAAVSHVVTFASTGFLLVSELSLFKIYFLRNWPLLGAEHGFVTLAIAMVAIGVNLLSNLNSHPDSQSALSLPVWRLVISAGIVIFCLGFINVIANYLLRDTRQGVTARQVRSRSAAPFDKDPLTVKEPMPSTPLQMKDVEAQSQPDPVERSVRNHFISITPNIAARRSLHPSYYPGSPSFSTRDLASPKSRRPVSSVYSRATNCTKAFASPFYRFGRQRDSVVPPVPLKIDVPAARFPNVQVIRKPEVVRHADSPGQPRYF